LSLHRPRIDYRGNPQLADAIIATLKQGMAEGRLAPRVVMPKVLAQLRSLSKPGALESPLWAIVPRLPGDWPDADRQAIKARIKQAIEQDVAPAYARLADFVETVYLPACPDRVGLCATADGAAHYAFLVRDYTTTDLTPGTKQLASDMLPAMSSGSPRSQVVSV
jgi:uncharacterized protein (DUF885 family)